ncbi:MAG TPA: PaaX family transcriptional regulator C-terminal domain-containing protein [Kofleriaceae bacterium]|nr:PaaX family transcriptional regulator C-terminal domain-containing protein [Kofleriaceae bacterium]
MKLTAKRVVLQMLSAVGDQPAPASSLVRACAILGISENNTRVTLARLLADGTLEASARGEYRLGGATEALTREVTGWRDVEKQVRRWDGSWVAAFAGPLGRSDRGELRRRERALRLLGFAELERDLAVRPDNLGELRERLYALGLDRRVIVFTMSELDARTDARARKLWDGRALERAYEKTRERLDRWIEREPSMHRDAAARESFLLGGEAIRQILFDPRLPEPLVDAAARRALVDAMKRFDLIGRRIWTRLFGVAPEAHEAYLQ